MTIKMTQTTGYIEEDDDRAALEASVAELLVGLSAAAETPIEFESAGAALEAAEVRFDDASWMSALASVQGWLRLAQDLQLGSTAEFIETLARELGYADPVAAMQAGRTDQLSD